MAQNIFVLLFSQIRAELHVTEFHGFFKILFFFFIVQFISIKIKCEIYCLKVIDVFMHGLLSLYFR